MSFPPDQLPSRQVQADHERTGTRIADAAAGKRNREFVNDDHGDPQLNAVPQLDFRMSSAKHPATRPEPRIPIFGNPTSVPRHGAVRHGANVEHDAPDEQFADGGKFKTAQPPAPHAPGGVPVNLPLDLGKLAHELRTPIGAIVALAEVMRDERFGALGNARYKGYANDIHQSARHALAVLAAMMDAEPGADGRADPRGQMAFERLELNALARGCVSGLQPIAAKAGVRLRTALNPQPLSLLADRRSVKQIVLNLLSNALKFTPAGGTVTVATSIVPATAPTGASAQGSPVVYRLDVRDTGRGMSADLIASVLSGNFDGAPLNLNATDVRPIGIGLPMAQALAEANGGHISIASGPEGSFEGTIASLHLPCPACATGQPKTGTA